MIQRRPLTMENSSNNLDQHKIDVIKLLNMIGVSTKYIGYDYIVEESLIISERSRQNKKIVLIINVFCVFAHFWMSK